MTVGWDCTAYGPEAAEVGALCFVAVPGTRKCRDEDECREVMTGQRQRVFRRISEMAASGDETGTFLEGKFSPDQILGGEDSGRITTMSGTTAGDEWLTALQVRNLTRDALEARGARFIGAGMEMAGQSPVADLSVDYGGRRYRVVITDTGKAGPWL